MNITFIMPDLEPVIIRNPPVVTPNTSLLTAIMHMCAASTPSAPPLSDEHPGCVLVCEDTGLVGIVTERDIVRLSSDGQLSGERTVAEVMTHPVITLRQSALTDLFSAIHSMHQHHIRHLPIVDDQDQLVGVVSQSSLRRILRPADLLRLRTVAEVMITSVIQANPTDSVLAVIRLMTIHTVSSVVIVKRLSPPDPASSGISDVLSIPLGIMTERDIVRWQASGLDLEQCQVQTVMSTPVCTISSDALLWQAHEVMQQRQIRHLVVTGVQGELVGIITQSNLLQTLNPHDLYLAAQSLEERIRTLEAEKVLLLEQRTTTLEQDVVLRTDELQAQLLEQQQLTQALQISERKFRDIFNNTFHFIGVLTPDGILQEANQTTLDFGGLRLEDVVNRPFWEGYWWTIAPATQAQLQAAIHLAAQGEFVRYEAEVLGAGGQTATIDFSLRPVKDASGQVLLLIAEGRNITERKQAEQALHELNQQLEARVQQRTAALQASEIRYRALMDQASDAILLADRQGNLLGGNRKAEELLGYTNAELASLNVTHIHPPQERSRIQIGFQTIVQEKTSQLLDTQVVRKDGHLVPVDITGAIIDIDGEQLVQGILRDISTRKQAEARLLSITSLQHAILNSTDYAIISTDPAGIIQTFNAAAEKMLGYAASEVIGQVTPELIHDPEEVRQRAITLSAELGQTISPSFAVLVCRASAGMVSEEEWTYVRKDGRRFPVFLSVTTLQYPDGQIMGFLGIAKNITRQKQAEAQLRYILKELSNFKYALDQAAIVSITDSDGVITYANDRFCQISGYERAALLGNTHRLINSGYHPQEFFADLWTTITKGQVWRNEICNRSRDGRLYWVDATVVPFLNEAGQPVQYIAIRSEITNRKQAEVQLRKSEAHLRTAQRIAHLGSWEFDVQTRAISWSPEVFRIFGLDPERQPPSYSELEALMHPQDRQAHNDLVQQAIQHGQSYDIEYRFYHPDSNYRVVLARGEAICNASGQTVRLVGTVLDITERKQNEEVLRNLSDRLTVAVQSGAIGIWEWCLDRNELIWDDRMHELYGIDHTDFTGDYAAWVRNLHPDDRARAEADIQNALQGEKEFDTEFRVIHADGSVHFIKGYGLIQRDTQGVPQRMIGINFDITDRKEAEIDLQYSEQRYRFVVNSVTEVIFQTDNHGRWTFLNPAWESITGFPVNDALGRPFIEFVHPNDRQVSLELFAPLINREKEVCRHETRYLTSDGGFCWMSVFARLIINDVDAVVGVAGTLNDISERKATELALQQTNMQLSHANAELERATRLKDEFLANMSHELRTPLNAILGFTEGLQEQVFGVINERQRKAIATIERSGRHLLELINDILDLSKIEADKLELDRKPVAVRTLCDTSLTFVRQMAVQKRIALDVDIADTINQIYVDDRRMNQVLINLLTNAVKFTPEGGSVRLEVRLESATMPAVPTKSPPETLISFAVIDTGIGIAAEHISKLFQAFVQIDSNLNRQHSGTGLGLVLVRQIVTLHGGTVSVASEVGKGSCFTVRLPYGHSVEGASVLPTTSSEAPVIRFANSENRQVIIIEDSIDAAEQFSRYLEEVGMQATVYPWGEGAVEKVIQIQPALIILDIRLPNLSGWEVLAALKSHLQTRSIPVLVISVVDDPERGFALGAAEYLVKPITRAQFRAVLQKLFYPQQADAPALIVISDAGPHEANATAPVSRSPLILLAEDNQANIDTIFDYLSGKGYQLIVAHDGKQAIEMARAKQPDLILMDIQMPEMDGLEAIRRLRTDQHVSQMPIIALTALAMPNDRERCLAAGANDYMAKPVQLRQLVVLIQQLLRQHPRSA